MRRADRQLHFGDGDIDVDTYETICLLLLLSGAVSYLIDFRAFR